MKYAKIFKKKSNPSCPFVESLKQFLIKERRSIQLISEKQCCRVRLLQYYSVRITYP